MRKKAILLLMCLNTLNLGLVSCKNQSKPFIPPIIEDDSSEIVVLPIKEFASAYEAFTFGKNYFENVATHYVTTQFGQSIPSLVAGPQLLYSRRYKSSNGDFLSEIINYTGGSPDSTISLKFLKEGENLKYKLIRKRYSKKNPAGAQKINNTIYLADFKGVNYDTALNINEFEQISGGNPLDLSIYKITEESIIEVIDFNRNPEDLSYTFTFKMNAMAIEDYKRQVKWYSTYDYRSFSYLELSFKIDKYGRIREFGAENKYSISIMLVNPTIVSKTMEYYYYSKNYSIDFKSSPNVALKTE